MTLNQDQLAVEELNNREVTATSPLIMESSPNATATTPNDIRLFDYPKPQNSIKLRITKSTATTRTESTAFIVRNGKTDGC